MTIFEKDNFDFLDKKTRQILLASRESFVPHTPYRYEKDMLEAVRIGDMDLAKQCMEALEKTGQAGRLSSSPLRQAQIIFISYITQITRAAMDAGVAEDLAYAMSDSYIQTSEECTSPSQIQALRERALRDFVSAVKHKKESPPYSKAVRKAIHYIHSHLQEKISLPQLARASGLSRGRFSHLFKEETGMSPMAYLQKERLETACSMLLYTDYPLSEISAALCFSSESHFIRIFREYTGRTPGRYRKSQS